MNFKESLQNTKLDFNKLILIPQGGSSLLKTAFDLSPKSFLRYAKDDMHLANDKGIINALSNAKRAIDCQTDNLLNNLGIDYVKLPKSIEPFVKYFDYKDDLPYKLKIIQGINFAPAYILAKCRNLRNKLEHFYSMPTIEVVKETIDIADLYIKSIEGSYNNKFTEFSITDKNNLISEESLKFNFGYNFEFCSNIFSIREIGTDNKNSKIIMDISNPEFLGFVRLWNSFGDGYELVESMKVIAELICHPMPLKNVVIEEI